MNSSTNPERAREFAVRVVADLRAAGHEAYWAGGCVRDQLLGVVPQDYDVATDAHPKQIQELFGRRRTIPIGAAFGVITVLGPRGAGQIEVATFRRDGGYSDGRHPDHVNFSSAEEDAQRRDFTINGLFFDPNSGETIDFVGGRADLEKRIVRCIGNADERFDEDKLRMLRAVRFATTLSFSLHDSTLESIRLHASEIDCVSPERIASEMRRLLSHPDRLSGLKLLRDSHLAAEIFPEIASSLDPESPEDTRWQLTSRILDELVTTYFTTATAACVWAESQSESFRNLAANLNSRWRLANEEHRRIAWLLENEGKLRKANQLPWPQIQRILIQPDIRELIQLSRAVGIAIDGDATGVDDAEERLQWPTDKLNPAPYINGNDLQQLGIPRGPQYRVILESVRDAQLDAKISSREEAIAWARATWRGDSTRPSAENDG